ncbi:p32K [Odocoileus adenovirus 1]|uniref:32K n=2 Tax=Deer atadenovirus A TaxID=2169706 RepID=A0A515MFZ3_9ADEN|nr:p32K [Odocoileus adenovirus 1]QDM55312.1 p32K [Deer atadenovirus A]ASU50466.1 p32K [Odocoileus adenovirus 1]ASU50493.1 p32K [Odocoileus adenovirus 1]ASU50631.1 p32K [Odocoileus adenovirus 1]QEM20929.1 32K [Deer atadenovirus A]
MESMPHLYTLMGGATRKKRKRRTITRKRNPIKSSNRKITRGTRRLKHVRIPIVSQYLNIHPPQALNKQHQPLFYHHFNQHLHHQPNQPLVGTSYPMPSTSIFIHPPTINNSFTKNVSLKRDHQPDEIQVFHDAQDHFEIKRTDGENDSDINAKKKWSLEDVLSFLQKVPHQLRKIILTSLFGATIGLLFDLLLGGPWGLTTRLLRLIISLVPGGNIFLTALDGLGYLLGKSANPFNIAYDPDFQNFGNIIQSKMNDRLAEDVAKAAEEQIGNGFMRTLASLLSAAASAGTHLKLALPAIPIAAIRPFQR